MASKLRTTFDTALVVAAFAMVAGVVTGILPDNRNTPVAAETASAAKAALPAKAAPAP